MGSLQTGCCVDKTLCEAERSSEDKGEMFASLVAEGHGTVAQRETALPSNTGVATQDIRLGSTHNLPVESSDFSIAGPPVAETEALQNDPEPEACAKDQLRPEEVSVSVLDQEQDGPGLSSDCVDGPLSEISAADRTSIVNAKMQESALSSPGKKQAKERPKVSKGEKKQTPKRSLTPLQKKDTKVSPRFRAIKRKTENVWEYPRPAILEPTSDELRIVHQGVEIARTVKGYRALETSHPPTYYIPLCDIQTKYLREMPGVSSFCEWKGRAVYYELVVGGSRSSKAAWQYPKPNTKVVAGSHGWKDFGSGAATGVGGSFGPIAKMASFYASKVDEAYVAGERVIAQEGDYYGGWKTSWISDGGRGMKGGPGTIGW